MSAVNINRVAITGNLTKDPELRRIGGEDDGVDLCEMRIAVNARRKRGNEWVDRANFFDVVVWGARGKLCSDYLHRGKGVAIDGHLEWREWEGKEDKKHYEAITIVADNIQFLWPKPKTETNPDNEPYSESKQREMADAEPAGDVPGDSSGLGTPEPVAVAASSSGDDDSIPF